MRSKHRTSGIVSEETAGNLARTHHGALEPSSSLACTILETVLREATVTIESTTLTDNSARPRSILMGDCTVDEEEQVYEILVTEQLDTSEVPSETNSDGTISMNVGDIEEHASLVSNYETVEVILYEE